MSPGLRLMFSKWFLTKINERFYSNWSIKLINFLSLDKGNLSANLKSPKEVHVILFVDQVCLPANVMPSLLSLTSVAATINDDIMWFAIRVLLMMTIISDFAASVKDSKWHFNLTFFAFREFAQCFVFFFRVLFFDQLIYQFLRIDKLEYLAPILLN